jgi:hypothetical protein
MHKENEVEKRIGEDNGMNNYALILNKSLGEFIIGDNIEEYLRLSHTVNHIDLETYSYDSYAFYNNTITIWTTSDNKIDTIRCESKCYFKNQNLIGIPYEKFIVLVSRQPDSESTGYVPVYLGRRQKQKVYEFIALGLQIWVWRKKIKEVLISQYDNVKNYTLIPNKSFGRFVIGDNIEKYLHLNHLTGHSDMETFSYDSYDFYNKTVTIWTTEDNKIETIRCYTNCYWRGQNLIGMLYEDFPILSDQESSTESIEYVQINSNRGQNQKVYEFDKLGLSVWVWRGKIKTVLVSKYDPLG